MPNSKQTHIFATRADLEPGLKDLDESEVAVKYVRCGLYYGATFEQYVSLLGWDDLGKNATGDHMTGAQFLVVGRNCQIKVREIPQGRSQREPVPALKNALMVGEKGKISKIQQPFNQYLDSLERKDVQQSKITADSTMVGKTRYDVSQLANPDSITFLPGGIFDNQEVLVCGHIGTASKSPDSLSLYKVFVKSVTKGFVKIGSYRVGPEAERLMNQGYRMVTIGVGSPREYDLCRL